MLRDAIIRPSVYYSFVFLFTLLAHFQFGWNHPLFPKSLTVLLVAGLVGLPWMALNLISLFSAEKRSKNMCELCVHILFFAVVSFIVIPNL